jgi:methyl-accepting chemotaxis protein
MKWKSVRIRTQLIAAFLMMLLLVLALGTVSYTDSLRLFQIEQTLFDHPLQVRSAIGSLKISLLNIRIGVRDFALAGTNTVRIEAERVVEVAIADAELEFDTIRSLYLGPPADVDRAFKAFVDWRTLVRDDIRMELDGAPGVISSSIGTELLQAYDRVVTETDVIDTFATNKADQLQKDYARQVLTLQTRLLLIFVAAFLLMVLIGFALVRRIQTPLDLLTEASKNIRNGDLSARSKYDQGNEFGTLSDSFNAMAASL